MKKLLILGVMVLTACTARPANASGNWAGPLIGGIIIGNMMRPYVAPQPPVIYAPPPVYVNPNPYGVPPNPYLYQYPRQCRLENVYNGAGQYLGQQQFCN